jgi:uncharacterized protein YllA (UPF0747 family)
LKTINKISFQDIQSIPQLIKDFLNHEIEGFEEKTFSLDHFKKQIAQKQNSFTADQRNILASNLERQLAHLELSFKQNENIDHLRLSNTFTITTGHQLNLFSGPVFLYTRFYRPLKPVLI